MKKTNQEIMNHEYLMTNGLGGYSFGTLDQVNCRKYHGLYTVSYNPPIERTHLISKLQELITIDGKVYPLTFENVPSEKETETNLINFTHEGIIEQWFQIEEAHISVERTIAMKYGSNHLAVRYQIASEKPVKFEIIPLYNFRDHHDTITPDISEYSDVYSQNENVLEVSASGKSVFLKIDGHEKVSYHPNRIYSQESYYPIETQRGYPDIERHAIMGSFIVDLEPGQNKIDVLVNITNDFESADEVFLNRKERYQQLIREAGASSEPFKRLVQAADDFIVYRKTTGKMTIIAGYPWFTDWGRDTMIAIPGLTLETGRSAEALQMIEGFLEMSHMGIIPNNFPDEGQPPMYNTSDGTLWLFNAMYAYYQTTNDLAAVEKCYPQMMRIINHHIQGTINDIYMDHDGLLSSGNEETQLTWMDVKVNGWVVTPRHGKAVEINALWYNAIAIMHEFTQLLGVKSENIEIDFGNLMSKIKKSFNALFWNEKDQNLYDLIIDGNAIDIPRPNMIFAVSLPFAVLDEKHWKAVVGYVQEHFKMPYGLLTLRREDENFHKTYDGDLLSRDGAYHRGTAWGWLIGPYLEAHFKTYHDLQYVKASLDTLMTHLDEGIHGSISEIFEGGAPHAQRGCSAQAWSVAEAIRIWKMVYKK